jgi:hypothetical protein
MSNKVNNSGKRKRGGFRKGFLEGVDLGDGFRSETEAKFQTPRGNKIEGLAVREGGDL